MDRCQGRTLLVRDLHRRRNPVLVSEVFVQRTRSYGFSLWLRGLTDESSLCHSPTISGRSKERPGLAKRRNFRSPTDRMKGPLVRNRSGAKSSTASGTVKSAPSFSDSSLNRAVARKLGSGGTQARGQWRGLHARLRRLF